MAFIVRNALTRFGVAMRRELTVLFTAAFLFTLDRRTRKGEKTMSSHREDAQKTPPTLPDFFAFPKIRAWLALMRQYYGTIAMTGIQVAFSTAPAATEEQWDKWPDVWYAVTIKLVCLGEAEPSMHWTRKELESG